MGPSAAMSAVHANTPRYALTRIENMVAVANFNMPWVGVRRQVAAIIGNEPAAGAKGR